MGFHRGTEFAHNTLKISLIAGRESFVEMLKKRGRNEAKKNAVNKSDKLQHRMMGGEV